MDQNWDLIGSADKFDKKVIRRIEKNQLSLEQLYKFHRRCVMCTHREELGWNQPDYCSGEFWTNKENKLTCSSFCSVDLSQLKNRKYKKNK